MQPATQHQRDHGQQHGCGQDRYPGQVQALATRTGLAGQDARGGDHQHGPERHVDQKGRPPCRTEEVGGDQDAAQHLAGDSATGKGEGVVAHGPCLTRSAERPLDPGQDLGNDDGCRRALGYPGGDQDNRVGGEAAGQGGEGEPAQADQEHPPVAVRHAEASSDDQQHRVRQHRAGGHQLQLTAAGMEICPDGRHRHVRHRGVDVGQELPGEQNQQHDAGAAVRNRVRCASAKNSFNHGFKGVRE